MPFWHPFSAAGERIIENNELNYLQGYFTDLIKLLLYPTLTRLLWKRSPVYNSDYP